MAKSQLFHGQVAAAAASVYTSTGAQTSIFSATVVNTSAAAVTLSVWLVASGGSQTDANAIYQDVSVPADETKGLQALINVTMPQASDIYMEASSATSLTVQMSGDVHS